MRLAARSPYRPRRALPFLAVALAGLLGLAAAVPRLAAQTAAPTATDSALVGRILLAEDGRDAGAAALRDGLRHPDARIRALATRAQARIADSAFSDRARLMGDAVPPPRWAEPEWKPRFRALTAARDDCAALQAGLGDREVPVRLRAAALLRASCAGDDALVATLAGWVDAAPPEASAHPRGVASWQLAGHGLVALARLRPDSAQARARQLARHPQWNLRQYAARAAALTQDRDLLRQLASDPDGNVVEAAVDGLRALTTHADDDVFLAVLSRDDAQAVRAAAVALKGSTHRDVSATAQRTLDRYTARGIASERDVRLALQELLGQPPVDSRAPARRPALGRDAIALALGAERYLEVLMAPEHGGGHFTVRLRGDLAPLMAAQILDLARAGRFTNTTWHRVEHDFVVQGGWRGANEYVGNDRFLVDELATLPHPRGSVGMSTRGHDTGDAQWFINLRDNARLMGDYTVFAEVVDGMDVVDAILEGDRIASIREVIRPL